MESQSLGVTFGLYWQLLWIDRLLLNINSVLKDAPRRFTIVHVYIGQIVDWCGNLFPRALLLNALLLFSFGFKL